MRFARFCGGIGAREVQPVGIVRHEARNGLLADAVCRGEIDKAQALAGGDFEAGELAHELHGELGAGGIEDKNSEGAERLERALGDLLV